MFIIPLLFIRSFGVEYVIDELRSIFIEEDCAEYCAENEDIYDYEGEYYNRYEL